MKIQKRVVYPLLVAIALTTVLFMTVSAAFGDDAHTQTLFRNRVITTTINTPAIGVVAGSVAPAYEYVYAHVTVDVEGGGNLAVTPQVSADNVNWTTAVNYIENHTDGTLAEASTAKTLSADGTYVVRVPVTAPHIRFSIAPSGTVTSTMVLVYRK